MSKEKKLNSNNPTGENDLLNLVHFKKVNIIGATGVGKRSLLSFIEKYDNKDFQLPEKEEKDSNNSGDQGEEGEEEKVEPDYTPICEEVQKIKVKYKDNQYLYLHCYISNLSDNNIDFFIMNSDSLLSYTQCLLIMVDISSLETFTLLSNVIIDIMKKMSSIRELRNTPVYFISNKMDFEMSREVSGLDIKELLDKFEVIKHAEISLKTKENLNVFLDELLSQLASDVDQDSNFLDEKNFVHIQEPPCLPDIDEKNGNYPKLKLLLLGSSGVGKTTFIHHFFSNKFVKNTIVTIGVDVEKTLARVDQQIVILEIVDTAGQEKFKSINKKLFCKCDGFLLLFDVTDRKSFDGVNEWIKSLRNERGSDYENYNRGGSDEAMFLIGNKIDIKEKRQVPMEDAIALAQQYNLKYYETSCCLGINIYEIMNDLILETFSHSRGRNDSFTLKRRKAQDLYVNKKKKTCC